MPYPLSHKDMCWMLHFTFRSWIISRFNRAWPYKGLKIWDWQIMTDWLRIVIHKRLVLWVWFPLEATLFFADFETPLCQFCTKMAEVSDLCYLGKTRKDRSELRFSSCFCLFSFHFFIPHFCSLSHLCVILTQLDIFEMFKRFKNCKISIWCCSFELHVVHNKEASWLHAELFSVLVSMWLPQQHLVSIWTPHGIHVETTWCPVETT